MAALASESRQRTGSASSRATSSGWGQTPSGASAAPMDTTCETSRAPTTWWRNAWATAPRATRAAVSRALARSSTGRASSKPYFCMPARSAWPGRGRVSGALRASPSSSSAGTGSALMTRCHFGHSLLPMRMAIGPPWVRPCRTPPSSSTSSRSKDIRAPRPWPSRRRASASAMTSVVTSTPAGQALEGGEQGRAVRLPCSQPAQHAVILARSGRTRRCPARSPGRAPVVRCSAMPRCRASSCRRR